jgi:hypothetical protein
MPEAKLKFGYSEIVLGEKPIALGRATDNDAAFPDDSNVSRYHAEIEYRGGAFWINDLGSSNGTTVGGLKVSGEMQLKDGDKIVLGGSSELEFLENDGAAVPEAAAPAGSGSTAVPAAAVPAAEPAVAVPEGGGLAQETTAASKPNVTFLVAGGICGLAVICMAAAAVFYYTRGSRCDARAVITKPEPGDTIAQPVDIEVDSENTGCVASAMFTLDGVEFAAADEEPYTAKLDPKDHPDLSDGFEHRLEIVLVDSNGEKIVQPQMVALAFETREIAKPSPTPEIAQANTPQQTGGKKGATASLIDIGEMAKRLVKQFPATANYNVSNKQFLQEIQKKTGEYAQPGYFQRAAAYRDAINVAYVQEQNVDAGLGFMLAMSRSKFNPAKQGSDEGLWHMTADFAAANGYNGLCGTETLSDPSQNCAAKASALYMKAIVWGVFDGDPIYSAAAFGKSPQDAGSWKATLPADRTDVWNVIKGAPEREQLVRFFAAGIVAENPQKFGLKTDRPLSELYKVTM